jgi:predicted secreted protein
MRYKFYRKCLLSVVILAIIVGIFYYLNYAQKQNSYSEGTLVKTPLIKNGSSAMLERVTV